MTNPYIQVVLTYLRNPFTSVKRSLLISGILFFFALFFFVSGFSEKHEFLSIHLFLFIILFAYWAIHVKEQFADARASLIPDFRKINGVVAAIVAIVFVILLPGVIAPLIGWQSFGVLSISTLLFGIILWTILRPGFAFALLLVVAGWGVIFMNTIQISWQSLGFVSIITPFALILCAILRQVFLFALVMVAAWGPIFIKPIQNGIEQIVCGNESVQAFTIMIIGAILSITGAVRLFLLNEEMPGYNLIHKIPTDGRSKLSDLLWQKMENLNARGWPNWSAGRPDLIRHAQNAEDSHWSRMRRWNYSTLTHGLTLFLSVVLTALLTEVTGLVVTSMDVFTHTALWPAKFIIISTLIPAFLAVVVMHGKNCFFSRDLMMPVSRSSYLKQLGMSVAINQFGMWVWMIASTNLLLSFTTAEKPRLEFLIHSITYSGMLQIWMFGLAVWLLSYRSFIVTLLVMYIALIPTLAPIFAFDTQMLIPWRSTIILFGNLLVVIGLLLTWWGYRRWLVADFN